MNAKWPTDLWRTRRHRRRLQASVYIVYYISHSMAYIYISHIYISQLVCLAAFQCYSYAPVTVSVVAVAVAVGNIFTLFELSQQLTLQVFKYLPQLWHVATVLWQLAALASCLPLAVARRDNATRRKTHRQQLCAKLTKISNMRAATEKTK